MTQIFAGNAEAVMNPIRLILSAHGVILSAAKNLIKVKRVSNPFY